MSLAPEPPVVPDEPPVELRYHRHAPVLSAPSEIWRARLLIRALAEREIRAQYKQAVLGVAWAVITPVMLMLVLTIFFQRIGTIDTQGVPYSLFAYIGLVPWNFFSGSTTSGGLSLVSQMSLVNKLNCPREVFPLSSIVVVGCNSTIASLVLLLLFAINGFMPKATTPLAVFPFVLQLIFTIAVTLLVSCTTVYLRDLRHALPILLQLGFFATPIAYGLDAIAPEYRVLYSALNPMGPIIDSYRRTVLYGTAPDWGLLGVASVTTAILLVGGLKLFRRLEMGFADVA